MPFANRYRSRLHRLVPLLTALRTGVCAALVAGATPAVAGGFDNGAFGGKASAFGASDAFGGQAKSAFSKTIDTETPVSRLIKFTVALPATSLTPQTGLAGVARPLLASFKHTVERPVPALAAVSDEAVEVMDGFGRALDTDRLEGIRGLGLAEDTDELRQLVQSTTNAQGNSSVIVGDFVPTNVIDTGALAGAQGAMTVIQNAANNVTISTITNINVTFNSAPF